MRTEQVTSNTSSVQVVELTPEVVNAVLQHLAATHEGVGLGNDDVAAHVANGGRGLAAGAYAAEIVRRATWEGVQSTLKRHLAEIDVHMTVDERLAVAKLAGLLGAIDSGLLGEYDDQQRDEIQDALIEHAERLAREVPSHTCAAWNALVEMTVYLHIGKQLEALVYTALDGARRITGHLFEIDPALADQLVADLRELSNKRPSRDAA